LVVKLFAHFLPDAAELFGVGFDFFGFQDFFDDRQLLGPTFPRFSLVFVPASGFE
jgi:hypothetical protein